MLCLTTDCRELSERSQLTGQKNKHRTIHGNEVCRLVAGSVYVNTRLTTLNALYALPPT